MTLALKRFARKSRASIVVYKIYNNWRMRRRFKAGDIEAEFGASHRSKTVAESLAYIEAQFADYLKYSGLSPEQLHGKRVLELGFGDNLGVALKFLAAGASEVVCLDKFYAKRDSARVRNIYNELRGTLSPEARQRFDEVITLDEGVQINNDRLKCINGVALETWADGLAAQEKRFDIMVSRAVVEEIYDPRRLFIAADKILQPGGYTIHKIDMSDYGVFSGAGLHPLTFMTIPETIYRLMASDSAMPNRKLKTYYHQLMKDLGYAATFFVSTIIGVGHLSPYKHSIELGVDYTVAELALAEEIRPRLERPYQELPNEELIVDGILVVGRKPTGNNENKQG